MFFQLLTYIRIYETIYGTFLVLTDVNLKADFFVFISVMMINQ